MSASARIARSTGVVAAGISISRILGFLRDILLAGLFGTGLQAQAFVVAFRLPNMLRDLVAEGAVTSAFVPVLSWYRAKRDPQEFWRLSQALATRLLLLVLLLGIVGTWAAPAIVRVVAPGFAAEPEKLALTVQLTRLLFPFITLVGVWAFFMGLLNSLGHFAAPALGPAALNLAMIIACLWVAPGMEQGIVAVVWAVLLGGVIQLLMQLPPALRLGFRWRWRWAHPGAQEILRLLGPRLLGSAVYQASVLIDTFLASFSAIVGAGAVAALYFANRLVQLPLAVFGTASAQASLPALAEQAAHQDLQAFRATLTSVLRMVAFVILPSAVGLIVLAGPIVGGLFERGAFDHHATVMTSRVLACSAVGLLAYAVSKVMTGAFYALKDTRTPVRLAMEALGVNLLLSLLLMGPLQVGGLALASALANSLNAYRLTRRMEARLGVPLVASVAGSWGRSGLAAACMGIGCWGLWRLVGSVLPAWAALAVVIPASVAGYAAACRLIGVEELTSVVRWMNLLLAGRRSASA